MYNFCRMYLPDREFEHRLVVEKLSGTILHRMTENRISNLSQIKPYLPPRLTRYLSTGIEQAEALMILKHMRAVRAMLSTYLPNYLVQSIIQNPEPGNVNGSFHTGALIFADVSGFTAMSEKLSVLGKEGAEQVTGIVNNYFTAMLEINDRFGGDLLKFGGDAMLIFFGGNSGPVKALVTASEMMQAMSAFTQIQTSQGVFPLKMKIGMAFGSIFLARLGTPQSMDHAVMGKTLFNLSQAENNASAGEIIVHQSMQEVTAHIARYSPLMRGFWRLEALDEIKDVQVVPRVINPETQDTDPDQDLLEKNLLGEANIIGGLKPFVPEELFVRIINDPQRIAIYGSHRPVTISFTNILGINEIIELLGRENEESITAILNSHFVTMSEVINRFGGTVNRLDAYSVGHRILGLFGALQAHDDDPQRAIQAALEMNRSLTQVNQATKNILNSFPEFASKFEDVPLRQRIGINSGFVFGCNTGSNTRREYTVMGDQVNLTARLMGIAQQGEVLIGRSTARQTDAAFDLVEKEAVKVKGKTEPLRNFAIIGVKQQSHRKIRLAANPIIGRDHELAIGKEAVDKTIRGQACLLVINGVSGLGKTRLAEELAWYGNQLGMQLLIGTCLSYGKTMTYHPWTEVLRELFGITVAEAEKDSRSRLAAVHHGMEAIGEEPWTPVIGTVLGLEIPDNDLTRDLDPKLRRQRVLDLTVKLLVSKSKSQPLMLFIQDAQWADPASMDLISYVARNITGQPILFLLPHRPDKSLPDWTDYPHAVNVELGDLSEEACKELIHDMLGGLHLPEEMYDLILSRGAGNPFFIGEVVRALIDSGVLERDADGNFQVIRGTSRVELPDTIHGVIISRIDRLLASDRRILQVASVIGRLFPYRTLEGVYPYQDEAITLRQRLIDLKELSLTEIQDIEADLYRFIHLTTREVVYEGLPFEHRRSLHRQIGRYIEEVFGENSSEQTSLIAYHYYEGQAWEKALKYNLITAKNAQREFANGTAILSAERALEAAQNLGPEVDSTQECITAREILGEVFTLIGKYDQALENFELARHWVERGVSSKTGNSNSHLAELARKTAAVYERLSEYETAFTWLEKGLDCIDRDQATIEATRIYLLGTGIYRRLGQNDQAADWCQKSLELASQIQSHEGQQAVGQAYYNLGGIENRRGDLKRALDFIYLSLEVYQHIDDVLGQARVYNNLGVTYSDLGEWEQAIKAYNMSLTISQQIGDIQRQGFLANNLANIHLYRGEWDQAVELFNQSNQIWKRIGSPLPDGVTMSNLAQVHIYQGNMEQARVCLVESKAIFSEIGSNDFLPELERRWSEFHLKNGDMDHALEHIERSIQIAVGQNTRLELGMSMRVMGDIKLALGEHQAASEALSRSFDILTELNSDYETARTMLSLVRLALAEGDVVDREQLNQAIKTFQKLDAQVDLTLARQLEAQT